MRLVNSFLAVLFLALAADIGVWGQAPIPEIDLKVAQQSKPALRFTGGTGTGGGVGGTGVIVAGPISVGIIQRDLASCKKGQGLLDVQLSNISKSSLTLPWSPDGARSVAPQGDVGVEIRFDDFYVTVTNEKGTTAVAAVTLFGNPLIPGSQVTLPPGQSALLRNFSIQSRQVNLCEENLTVTVYLSTNRALKSDGGYSLVSRERWRVRSQ